MSNSAFALNNASHSHVFGQDLVRAGERRTMIVVIITALMMIIEIIGGMIFGSMALLADGLHMASHAAALTVSVLAYRMARRYAHDARFSFGTGKLNSLAAFTSAIMLVIFAALMGWQSVVRLFHPVNIAFDQAIVVAVAGLLVNAACMFILRGRHEHHHEHDHHDHNLRAAYVHVLADALTSLLAIFALIAAKYFGMRWMDPLMGVAGAILVARWSWSLIRVATRVLLDRQAPDELLQEIRARLLSVTGTQIADLHVWAIGPGIFAADIVLIAVAPHSPDDYRALLPDHALVHSTIEVRKTDT